MSKLILDSEEISKLGQSASQFVMSAEAEKDLARLLEIQEQIGDFVEQVKSKLLENALELDGNFTGLKGDSLKIEYRAYGAVYEAKHPELMSDEFVTKKTSYALNTKAVEVYEEREGSLPDGVERKDRKKQLTIKRLKG